MHKLLSPLFLLLVFFTHAQEPYLFVGTYNDSSSPKGIYVYHFNTVTGTATPVNSIISSNPSYLALSKDHRFVYAVNENSPMGQVSAYSFDAGSGKLHFLNMQSSQGADPCYVSVDPSGKWVFAANYSGGNLAAFPVNGDGSLAPAAQVIQHTGVGFDKERQEKAHVHSVIFSPDGNYLMVADLGLDKEFIYRFDPLQAKPLSVAMDSFAVLKPGSGPRHIIFHPTKPLAYLIGELSGTIDAYHYDPASGALKPFQRINTHADDFTALNGSADIHISSNGRFLYASNRANENNLAVYSIEADGMLSLKQLIDAGGKHPRNFVIDPGGHFLLVANRDSNGIAIFSIDPGTGLLKNTGNSIKVSKPVCLKF